MGQRRRTIGFVRPSLTKSDSSVDGCAHIRFGPRGPHCAVAVGDFSLDHAGAQPSLRAVIGGVNLTGIIAKSQKLVAGPSDFCLQLACEVALRRRAVPKFTNISR